MSSPYSSSSNAAPTLNSNLDQHITSYRAGRGILFLSDVHLGSFPKSLEQQLEHDIIQLLAYCESQNYRLVILGDLFDYWMEYPGWHPPLGKEILDAFRSYHERHEPTLYITGNHDNWWLDHLQETGFRLENEFRILQVNQQQFFVTHGDGLSNPRLNLPRSLFNRLLRSQPFVRTFRTIFPPSVGISLMKLLSRVSKRMEAEKRSSEQTDLSRWADRLLSSNPVQAVICGHNHNPQIKTFREGTYLNPGPFGTQYTLGLYADEHFQLVQWDPAQQNLKDFKE